MWLEQGRLMKCPTCNSELATGQKFCHACGTNVAALTLPVPPAGPLGLALPVAPVITAPIATAPIIPAPVAPITTLIEPQRDLFAIVEQTIAVPAPVDPPDTDDVPQWVNNWAQPHDQNQFDQTRFDQNRFDQTRFDQTRFDETQQHHIQAPPQESRLVLGSSTAAIAYPAGYAPDAVGIPGRGSTVLAIVAGVAGAAAIIGTFVPMLTVTTDAPIPEAGNYKLNDLFLGTNLIIGVIITGVCILAGGILAALGKRLGAGLAAGAAVALAPVLIVIWGGVDYLSNRAEAHAVSIASSGGGGTFFRSKQGAGLWILIGAAAVGLIALCIALVQAGADGRPRLNLFIGVGGALASVVAAVGTMIPSQLTTFGDNFNASLASKTIIYGRLAMIALVAVAGAIGFLCNNRWGIGLALGGASFWIWQWLSSITKIGDSPLPPGFVPLGSADLKPHIVTTIGVVAIIVLATLALMTAPKNRTMAQ
jgi:hypothetical protein